MTMNGLREGEAARNVASFIGSTLFRGADVGSEPAIDSLYCAEGDLQRRVRKRSSVVPGLFSSGGGGFGGKGGTGGNFGGRGDGEFGNVSEQIAKNLGTASQITTIHRKKRILMLMSDTGGGHRASAQALKAALDELYPGKLDVQIVDVFAELSGPFFRSIPEQYNFMMKYPPLWRLTYASGVFWPTRQLAQKTYNLFNFGRLKDAFVRFDPDMIISVHPLCQGPPLSVLKRLGIRERVTFVTVVTDLGGANPTWFHSGVDRCYVPTQHLWDYAKRYNMKDDQLRQYGLPIRQMFWTEAPERKVLRRELGLKMDIPVVLVVGGGAGVGALQKVAHTVANRIEKSEGPYGAQLVIVCGKNERLREQLIFEEWPVPVKITGFISNMSAYMAASDCIITKAGPGTIAESLIRGLPIILSGYLPGQEYGNVKFVIENGVGSYGRCAEEIAGQVADLLGDRPALAEMSRRAKSLGRPEASYDIARNMGELLFENNRSRVPSRQLEAKRMLGFKTEKVA